MIDNRMFTDEPDETFDALYDLLDSSAISLKVWRRAS